MRIAITQPGMNGALAQKRGTIAFTLLEVMIAAGIFFMAIFAILSLVSTNIRNARYLQEQRLDPGWVLADFIQTNKLEEGPYPIDLSGAFPGYSGRCDVTYAGTNGLFQVDCTITKSGGGGEHSEESLSIFLYRPDSPKPGQQPTKLN